MWGLRLAIFPLFLPALVIHTRLTGGSKKMTDQDSWALLFAGCPAWMRRMLRGLYIYAAVNFAIVCVVVILSLAGIEIGADSRAVAWTDGWGVFMWLYGACLAIFTGAYRRGIAGVKRTPPAARHGS